MRLFLFSTSKAIWSRLLQPQCQIVKSQDHVGLVPNFRNLDLVQPRIRGAWQIALGLGLLGQAAALYFTLVRPLPFVAGAFFTLAFGNRTELLITLPLYLYLFWRQPDGQQGAAVSSPPQTGNAIGLADLKRGFRGNSRMLIRFVSLPAILALATAVYNFARFHSIFDFGYI